MIGYLKDKETKGIFIRKPKVMISVIFCDSNYSTDNETRNSVSSLVATLGGTLLTCLSKTQRTVTLSSIEAEYVGISSCTQEVKIISMLLEEMTEVQKPSAVIIKEIFFKQRIGKLVCVPRTLIIITILCGT